MRSRLSPSPVRAHRSADPDSWFLNRDMDDVEERLLTPFADFVLRHPLWLYLIYAAGFGLIWIFISQRLAIIGFSIAGLGIALVILGHAARAWRRRSPW